MRIHNQTDDVVNANTTNEIETILTNLIYDLILISSSKFNKLAITELSMKTPFVCVCNKELWLMIQLLIEKIHCDGNELNKFWFYFNNGLKSYRERKGFCVQQYIAECKSLELILNLFYRSICK